MSDLLNQLVRLAHEKPELREDLLPTIKSAASAREVDKEGEWLKMGGSIVFRWDGMTYGEIVDQRKSFGSGTALRYAVMEDEEELERYERLRDAKKALLEKVVIPKLRRDGYKKASSISREAQVAFDKDVRPYLKDIISRAQAEVLETITEISFGNFPTRQLEQMVMRHKSPSMLHEDFLDEILTAYQNWVVRVQFAK